MKRILMTATCSIGLLTAATFVKAQSTTATPIAKAAPDNNALKADNKATTLSSKEQNKNAILPLTEQATPATATPLTREEPKKPTEKPKMQVLSPDEKNMATPNTEENRQTMSGTAQRPKQQATAPVFVEPKPVATNKPLVAQTPAKQ